MQNQFIWFKKWIIDYQTINYISKASGYSTRTLKTYFHNHLNKAPVFSVRPSERVNLLIDATYFSKNICLVLYRDDKIKFTQLYRLTDGEHYTELREDLENLLQLGVQIESITCDGHKSLLKAIKKACPDIVLQRCIVHVQRMCRIWLSQKPKSRAGMELRSLISNVHLIKNHEQWGYWIIDLIKWHQQYEAFINEKSFSESTGRYWYKHRMVRRSFSVIKKALPDMFHYLDNTNIPKSTNGLESFFGHLKGNLNIHRGLSLHHRKQFISWYLYLKNKEVF